MQKVELVNGCLYHIYNRGVDKRTIFLDEMDYRRFICYLSDFNISDRVKNTGRKITIERGATSLNSKIVEVNCFSLIPNHFHIILKQLVDNGISKFMQKVETGHAMSFNKKYDRTGRLFEGHFKSKLIKSDEYFMHLSRYIHLNCLDLIEPGWKEKGIKDWNRANKFLKDYKWSSYMDYMGKNNFTNIINKGPLQEYFKNPEDYKKYVRSWMAKDLDLLELEDLVIE